MITSEHRRQKIQTDPRGKIKTGEKTERNLPRSLDHFKVDAFPEIMALYGEEPKELMIVVPSDNIPDVFDDRFALYGSNSQAIRKCDGDTCLHRISENIGGKQYGVGEESECVCLTLGLFDTEDKELRKKACRYTMNLKAFVLEPTKGTIVSTLPYLFETGSKNSGSAVYDALTNLAGLTKLFFGTPKLAHLPMKLWVKMVAGKEDAKLKFPIWELTPPTSISSIVERLTKVGKALGWDEDLMTRISSSRQLTDGTPIPGDIIPKLVNEIKATTDRHKLVEIGNKILALKEQNGLTLEEADEVQSMVKTRWSYLGFDKKKEEAIDPNNPLGI